MKLFGEEFSYDDYTILLLDNFYADISTNALSQFNLPNRNNISLLYLGEAIKTMAYCDTIMLAPGFEKARGCQYVFNLKKFTSVYHSNQESMNVIRKDEQ